MDRRNGTSWAGRSYGRVGLETRPPRVGWCRRAVIATIVLASAIIAGGAAPPRVSAEPVEPWPPIRLAGHEIAPGETVRFFVDLAGTTGEGSRMLDALVVVVRGAKPGPTLCPVAGVHGDELNGVEVAHRVYATTSASELAGTLIAVPTVNMQGLRSGNRYLPDPRDLNRAFPGNPEGSLASRIAHTLFEGVIRQRGALIDLHTGSASRSNVP